MSIWLKSRVTVLSPGAIETCVNYTPIIVNTTTMTSCSNERAFIRQSLFSHKVRLDGRGCEDHRELDLRLDRTEVTSSCELKIGSHAVLYDA